MVLNLKNIILNILKKNIKINKKAHFDNPNCILFEGKKNTAKIIIKKSDSWML